MGIKVITPENDDIETVNDVIYNELCVGKILSSSKQKYIDIIHKLSMKYKSEGVILGCTEIGLLIKQNDISLPVFDTTQIHARYMALLAIA